MGTSVKGAGGRRETLTIGRHEPVARHAQRSHLAYGMDVTLETARLLLARARVDVRSGRSPARVKAHLAVAPDSLDFVTDLGFDTNGREGG